MNEIISEIAGLRMELQEIAESFQKKKRDLLILTNEKLPMEERIKEIELTIAYEVLVESNESGKLAYFNDTLRNAEVRKRLKSNFEYEVFNFEYETLKEQLDFLDKHERSLKTEIEILDRKFRIIEQMVALVMVEGHILTHCKEVIDYERSN